MRTYKPRWFVESNYDDTNVSYVEYKREDDEYCWEDAYATKKQAKAAFLKQLWKNSNDCLSRIARNKLLMKKAKELE